jgi:multiple sugar transport system substrate-binding protein
MKAAKMVIIPLLLVAFLTACGKGNVQTSDGSKEGTNKEEAKKEETKPSEPVTLRIYQKIAGLSDTEFLRYFVEPVKKKFPHITLEIVRASQPGNKEEELLGSNTFPDLIYTSNPSISDFQSLGVLEDLTPYLQSNKLNLTAFDPTIIETVKLFGNGSMLALPFSINYGVMVYNKDIFDKFGVAYPKDGMTWEEAVTLSKSLTRAEGGVQYIGLDPYNITAIGSGLGLSLVDPASNKPTLQNDQWAKILRLYSDLFAIPGYLQNGKHSYGINGFTKDRNLAMYTPWLDMVVNQVREAQGINWDLAQLPNFEGSVGKGRETDAHILMLSSKSKNKEAAFQVMQVVTSSDEVQLDLIKQGRISVLNKPDWQKEFAAAHDAFKGKNVQAVFKSKPVLPHKPSKHDGKASSALYQSVKDLAAGGKDINTILRDADNAADQAIKAASAK